MQKSGELLKTHNLVKIGILGAMAFVLMKTLELPLPIFPSFLKIDFGDVPAVVASLTIHPFAGVLVVLIKNLLALTASTSGGIGEIVNVIVGMSFVLPIGIMTRKTYSLKNVLIGCGIGIVLMIIAGVITNAFLTLPLYGEEACIQMGAAINPRIVDKWTLLLYVFVPFNLLKGILVSTVSVIVVKGMQPVVRHFRVKRA